ncbi:hypothetical protein ES703_71337 [subsurface metagenome]
MIGYDNLVFNHQVLLDLPFREGIGALYTHDVAKPHHPLTMVGAPAWTPLASGLMVLTLTANDYIWGLAADTVDLDFTAGDYSLGGWFYFTPGGADDKTLMARFLLDNDGWELYHYTNEILTLRHHHAAGATVRTAAYSENWAFSKWWFMGVSRSGAGAQFYRGDASGLVALTTTISPGGLIDPETSGANFFVGTDTTGVNDYNGMLWRPRPFGKALSESEWRLIFEMERHWLGV